MMEADSSSVATMDASSGGDGTAGATSTQGAPPPSPSPPARESLWAEGLNWPTIAWFVAVHLGAAAALFTFSWPGLAAMAILSWFTASAGICLGYHRLFTHRSFKTVRPLRWAIALVGTLAGEGPLINWVADHRKHHALSDREGDPHSPIDGAWWSHILWMTSGRSRATPAHLKRWAPDLLKEPVLVWLDRMFLPLQFVLGTALFGLGYAIGGAAVAWSFVTWGVFLRLAYVLHVTWFVNSASHIWGYRNYATRDNSRNLWWVAVLTFGEGWHNNHHAYPRVARSGHKWWEFDPTYQFIRLFAALGWAWDIAEKPRGDAA
ncbi:MAG: acyl-CoA desaturase [Thermoguttaceae bacterium]